MTTLCPELNENFRKRHPVPHIAARHSTAQHTRTRATAHAPQHQEKFLPLPQVQAGKCNCTSWTCTKAAQGGHLDVLQWLELLQWARQWLYMGTCANAIDRGDGDMLRWRTTTDGSVGLQQVQVPMLCGAEGCQEAPTPIGVDVPVQPTKQKTQGQGQHVAPARPHGPHRQTLVNTSELDFDVWRMCVYLGQGT